jgi:flagellar hook assembly protein FlgD
VPVKVHAYPNPAVGTAHFVFSYAGRVTELTLRVYDLSGGLVYSPKAWAVGVTDSTWDLVSDTGETLPTGLYLCVVTAKDESGKLITSPIFKLLIAR